MSVIIEDAVIDELLARRDAISKNKKWGFNLPEKEFIKGMVCLNPQSYGARIEKYIKNNLGFDKVAAKENKGDLVDPIRDEYYEVKISLLTQNNPALNLVQIRLWQENDYYLCVAYDLRDISNYRKYIFLLTHDEMEKECEKANAAHGTSVSNNNNKNVELRLSIICDENNDTFNRWKGNYLIDDYDQIIEWI